jgi:hypothetical protein
LPGKKIDPVVFEKLAYDYGVRIVSTIFSLLLLYPLKKDFQCHFASPIKMLTGIRLSETIKKTGAP